MLNSCKGNEFDLHKNHLHLNVCVPGFALKLRHAATRKWPIGYKHLFQFLLRLRMVPRENKSNAYAKFGGTNKEYYGIFRSGLFRSTLSTIQKSRL